MGVVAVPFVGGIWGEPGGVINKKGFTNRKWWFFDSMPHWSFIGTDKKTTSRTPLAKIGPRPGSVSGNRVSKQFGQEAKRHDTATLEVVGRKRERERERERDRNKIKKVIKRLWEIKKRFEGLNRLMDLVIFHL